MLATFTRVLKELFIHVRKQLRVAYINPPGRRLLISTLDQPSVDLLWHHVVVVVVVVVVVEKLGGFLGTAAPKSALWHTRWTPETLFLVMKLGLCTHFHREPKVKKYSFMRLRCFLLFLVKHGDKYTLMYYYYYCC
jgi:hypothetical protein